MTLSSSSGVKYITYNGRLLEKPFDPSRHKNLLSYLEEQGVEVHYQCLEGYCGACRCKLLDGEIEYPIFPMACVRDGEMLTCCSLPLGDLVLSDPF